MIKIREKIHFFIILFLLPIGAIAQGNDLEETIGLRFARAIGLPQGGTPYTIIANLVNYALTFIGIIAVLVFMLGGFKLMLSMGDEEKVKAAKKTLISGVIGLIIMLLSYAIVSFIIKMAGNVLGG